MALHFCPPESERGPRDALRGLRQIRLRGDDGRILAPGLEDHRLGVRLPGRELPVEVVSHVPGSRERDPGHPPVPHYHVLVELAGAGEQVYRPGRHASLHVRLVHQLRRERRLLGRLPHHGVPSYERALDHAAPQHRGEVERRYHEPWPPGPRHAPRLLPRRSGRHPLHVALFPLHDGRVVPDGLHGLVDLGDGLHAVLPDLVGDRRRYQELPALHRVRHPPHYRRPLPPVPPAPVGERALRGVQGGDRLVPPSPLEAPHNYVGVDRAPHLVLQGQDVPPAYPHRISPSQELALDGGQRFLVPRVRFLVQGGARIYYLGHGQFQPAPSNRRYACGG